MNIGVGFYMPGAEREGIGWSITRLLERLLRLGSEHTFTVFSNQPPGTLRAEFQDPPNLDVVSFRLPSYTLWEQLGLPLALKRTPVDMFHSPLGLPLLCPVSGIATVHDLCFLTHPDTFTRRMRTYFRVFLPLSVRRARVVLTVSVASKHALMKLLHVPGTKIRVVSNGVGEEFRPIRDPHALAAVRERHGLPESFILYVGTLQPRKNVLTLIRACQRLWATNRIGEKLVIVGKRGWLSERLFEFVNAAGLRDRVVFAGYLPREDLPVLYSAASLFVYPSLCEGFGLPPLEAMACGTPVVASNVASLAEVLGAAARLIDPVDAEVMAATIREILADRRLRETLRDRGLERAKGYRWDEAARQTLGVYKEVADRSPAPGP